VALSSQERRGVVLKEEGCGGPGSTCSLIILTDEPQIPIHNAQAKCCHDEDARTEWVTGRAAAPPARPYRDALCSCGKAASLTVRAKQPPGLLLLLQCGLVAAAGLPRP
jgi:hypothetical protein